MSDLVVQALSVLATISGGTILLLANCCILSDKNVMGGPERPNSMVPESNSLLALTILLVAPLFVPTRKNFDVWSMVLIHHKHILKPLQISDLVFDFKMRYPIRPRARTV